MCRSSSKLIIRFQACYFLSNNYHAYLFLLKDCETFYPGFLAKLSNTVFSADYGWFVPRYLCKVLYI